MASRLDGNSCFAGIQTCAVRPGGGSMTGPYARSAAAGRSRFSRVDAFAAVGSAGRRSPPPAASVRRRNPGHPRSTASFDQADGASRSRCRVGGGTASCRACLAAEIAQGRVETLGQLAQLFRVRAGVELGDQGFAAGDHQGSGVLGRFHRGREDQGRSQDARSRRQPAGVDTGLPQA